jgi:hypothetical protein
MQFRVLLRLDAKDHPDLIATIQDLVKTFYGPCKKSEIDNVRVLLAKVIRDTQAVIEDAWGKVKSGEETFRFWRNVLEIAIALLTLVVIFVFVAAVIFAAIQYMYPPT